MSDLPGMNGWAWDEEIFAYYQQKQQEAEKTRNQDLSSRGVVYTKAGKVYIEKYYFEELAKQCKHRVSIIFSSFLYTETHYFISSVGYERLRTYLPLPELKDLATVP